MRPKVFLIIIIAVITFNGCEQRPVAKPAMAEMQVQEVTSALTSEGSSQAVNERPNELKPTRLIAVGDNLIHEAIYMQAKKIATDGGYDFRNCYSDVADIIKAADIAFINQETPLAGEVFKPSTYPLFNSPTQLGDQMLETGFDVFSHANNHIIDKGSIGISATLNYYSTKPDATVIGVYRNKDDYNNIRTITKNGITFAFVAFAEHTNGLKLRDDSEFVVSYLGDLQSLQSQLEQADKIADVVVAAVHWGNEGSHNVTKNQRNYAEKMSQWGADIIIGTHPHVLQPIEYIQPSGLEQKTLVAYSLGNFISAQDSAANLIGGILDIKIVKDDIINAVTITDVKLIPIITQYQNNYNMVKIIPFKNYNSELANIHGVKQCDNRFSIEYVNKVLNSVIGSGYVQY